MNIPFTPCLHLAVLCSVLAGTLVSLGATTSAADSPRSVLALDDDWRFHRGEAPEAVSASFDDSTWRQVDVPHDYVVEETFTEKNPEPRAGAPVRQDWFWYHAFLPTRPAVYRKTFTIPADAAGKRLWLEFDGVFSNSFYWVNGKLVGSEYSGYTRSRFDITAAAKPGSENIITVQVDPRWDGWWYEGGGIYRHVRLIAVDPIHISPDGVFIAPVVANPGDGVRADATAVALTDISNTSAASAHVTVASEILDAAGRVIATASSDHELGIGSSQKVTQEIALPGCHALVATKSLSLSPSQHCDGGRKNRRPGRHALRRAPCALRCAARPLPQRPATETPGRQHASGSRRCRRGDA